MATYYVSSAASNGYVVGNDSNDGLSKAAPFLTVGKALNASSAGDTIYLNDGTYPSSDGAFGATNFAITKALTIISETAFGAILTATVSGASSTAVNINANTVSSIELRDLVIDCLSTQHRAILRTDTTNDPAVTLTRVRLKDFLNFGYHDPNATSSQLTVTDCEITASPTQSSSAGINIAAATRLNVAIDGLDFDFTNSHASSGIGVNLRTVTGRTSATVSVARITGTLTAGVASSNITAVFIRSVTSAVVEDCEVTVSKGSGASATGVEVRAANSLDSNSAIVRRNTITLSGSAGNGIKIGAIPSGADANLIEDAEIYQNTIIGDSSGANTPHGIQANFQANVSIFRNTITQLCPALLLQRMSGGLVYSNTVKKPFGTTGQLYVKGSTGGKFVNNTVYLSSGFVGVPIRVNVGDDATNSSGVEFTNNLVYADATITQFVDVEASQAATFSNNLYFSTEALPAGCFTYQASSYDTVAAWAAAQEASAVSGNPYLRAPTNGDFRIGRGSAARGAGVAVSGVTTGFDGKAFKPTPSIGAYEFRKSSLMPLLLGG